MIETEEDAIIKVSKMLARKRSKGEHKDLMRVATALDAQEAGPWRSLEDASMWASDYHDMRDQGLDADAASDVANTRESIRIAAKVDVALSEGAMKRCLKLQMGIFGLSEEEATQKCNRDFTKDLNQRGEKAYESRSLASLDELDRNLRGEIIHFQYNCMDPKTPAEAEKLAREKLRLPKIITITKEDEKPKERVLLDRMPSTYGKSKGEVEEEVRKERREHG